MRVCVCVCVCVSKHQTLHPSLANAFVAGLAGRSGLHIEHVGLVSFSVCKRLVAEPFCLLRKLVSYWICTFSNNQYRIKEDVANLIPAKQIVPTAP